MNKEFFHSTVKLILAASLFISVTKVSAQEAPKQVFDATYTITTPVGSSTVRMLSDGKGHLRTETQSGAQKIVSISDYPNKVAYSLLDSQKMMVKTKLSGDAGVVDAQSAKKANAKSLGTKMIDGHMCQGWQYSPTGSQTQVWIGNDTQYLVHSESQSSAGKTTMALKSFSKAAPNANLFVVPNGYKVMEMPAQYTR